MRFKDFCKIKSAKRIFENEYVPTGIPFIRGQEISDNSIKNGTSFSCYITKERYKELKELYGVPQYNDILITAVGTIGNLCFVDFERPFYYKDGNIIQLTDWNLRKVYPKYIFYFMQSDYFHKLLNNKLIGAVQKALTMDMLNDIEIKLPDIEEQKKIVNKLDPIINKISLNTSICSTLESMAKLLYDYWFVQFDFPDENGKPYKSSGGKMVWNDELKREIPAEWEAGTFGNCISSINTGLNPRDNFKLNTGGTIKYLTVKNLTKEGTIDFSSCDFIDETARSIVHRRSDIKVGDILFASIAPLGRCCIISDKPEDWDINESVFSIRPDYQKMTSVFLYMTFMSDLFIKKAEGSSVGSVFKGIRISELQELKTVIPPKSVLDSFGEQVEQIYKMKSNAVTENQQLASLRDFLLPMLMNGQVKVA